MKYIEKLRNSGLRPTKQRLQICEVLFDAQKTFHFTINDLANNNNLFLNKICFIKGNISSPIKRIMMDFSFAKTELIKEELTIELGRHQYTKEYISICKDFYLKM